MSGAQIGTVVGGAIGAYFGGAAGAQIGMAIGGFVGGAIDPTKVKGPHIGDGLQQTATDGVPIAWVHGRARVAGTLVQVSPRREIKKTDDGKGSGTETITYEARQSFAVLICESDSQRGSKMDSVMVVEQDGQIVYDVREGSTILADSAKWIENVDFMFGDEDQLPHPTLEAITGVGNTPAYRGVLMAVFTDFNITAAGDRIPSFVFTLGNGNYVSESIAYDDPGFTYIHLPSDTGDISYASPDYDDSFDPVGKGGFGTQSHAAATTNTPFEKFHVENAEVIWLRKKYRGAIGQGAEGYLYAQDYGTFFVNGVQAHAPVYNGAMGYGIDYHLDGSFFDRPINTIAYRVVGTPGKSDLMAAFSMHKEGPVPPPYVPTYYLADIVAAVAKRGGLVDAQIDVDELSGIKVIGYPIATASSAADCLAPLLAAYFSYASEYDGQVHFRKFGADAALTVSPLDLVESDVGVDGGSSMAEDRKQQVEYPRKMISSYYDPDQSYQAVNVTYERNSAEVVAIGEQKFDIPVVMTADDAMQATVKAMKVAWATVEGSKEYSLPYVGHDGESYLSLTAGESVILDGKRWSVDELTISHNMLHLKTTYNRQSAYTTNVQAIPSNPPTPPVSQVGGPTTLYAMNLPSLRPQDTYGLYLAAAGETEAWSGCTVQISYDGGVSWQNATTIREASTLGHLTADAGPATEPVKVEVVGELSSVTEEQIAARMNGAAILSATDVAEIIQFQTATETGSALYDLTDVLRGRQGTVAANHFADDRFTMLDSVYFLPVDTFYAEKTLQLRAITFGDKAEDADIISIVYRPVLPTPPTPSEQLVADGVSPPTTLSSEDETDYLYSD